MSLSYRFAQIGRGGADAAPPTGYHGDDGQGALAACESRIALSNLEKRKPLSAEHARLEDSSPDTPGNWKAIGPYVSERAWGTVREDYSADGQAWQYFPYEHARARAPIGGTRTVWLASAIATRSCASPSPYGTAATPS